jgi:hypothetical protein|tara:strand:- start:13 stop:186 length:174 start_codon:yes stop_codon:yes gene_type:complete
MDALSKEMQLSALELALLDLDRIITTMKENNYSNEEVNEYVKKRWSVWNEMHKVKTS